MYERIQGNDMYNAVPNVPFSTNINFSNVCSWRSGTQLSNGQPLVAPITVASITGLDKVNNKLPVSYQYSFGVQRALSSAQCWPCNTLATRTATRTHYLETNLPDPSTQIPTLFANNNADYNKRVQYLGFHSVRQTETIRSHITMASRLNCTVRFVRTFSFRGIHPVGRSIRRQAIMAWAT